jgi:hypothetical protein
LSTVGAVVFDAGRRAGKSEILAAAGEAAFMARAVAQGQRRA